MTDKENESFVLNVRPIYDPERLFGDSASLTADGWAVVDGALWRYCSQTKTRWDTGWRYAWPNDFTGFPQGAEKFEVVERQPSAETLKPKPADTD